MVSKAFHLKDSADFIEKALHWANGFDSVCYLDSNGYRDNHGQINVFIAVGEQKSFIAAEDNNAFQGIQTFIDAHPDAWIPGFLAYDLKNQLEPSLRTSEDNRTDMPDAYFFLPRYTLLIGQHNVELRAEEPDKAMQEIYSTATTNNDQPVFEGQIVHRMTKPAYMDAFARIQNHLKQGDCYEINLCQEFYVERATIDPLSLYKRLNQLSPTPFSSYFKFRDQYILSASPERFLSKNGNTLISQPIKGTARRGKTPLEDELLKDELASNSKEISENIMIVDLVRNDLTRSAVPGTVRTTELAKVYSFSQVHQLISTITCQVDPSIKPTQAIAHAFPPGSMTGAPKISAMEIIDECENSRRGVYSGALGYFSPHGSFDFSVVIRTLLYNAKTGYLSFHTGGAITLESDPEQEYNECLLKGQALFEILKG